ncbi:hypothetical protein LEP1GSC193_2799 [Leptospira alstonii serovar Pingchang str. 80-412]|uniref:Uncharacterized protein n=2 Tax=Leptospira alstonii TaxID=28452 RepID=M6CX87_9LEPT|nr:hypothetical protein LEP1GSC194_2198 [Leptospira alstonii serovar Sichuan str. 79601]EQA80667.1 hypothetical protein LEP1GSC193_2799 [Leptospira alstonii serovar Pingchang str. 80-412]
MELEEKKIRNMTNRKYFSQVRYEFILKSISTIFPERIRDRRFDFNRLYRFLKLRLTNYRRSCIYEFDSENDYISTL